MRTCDQAEPHHPASNMVCHRTHGIALPALVLLSCILSSLPPPSSSSLSSSLPPLSSSSLLPSSPFLSSPTSSRPVARQHGTLQALPASNLIRRLRGGRDVLSDSAVSKLWDTRGESESIKEIVHIPSSDETRKTDAGEVREFEQQEKFRQGISRSEGTSALIRDMLHDCQRGEPVQPEGPTRFGEGLLWVFVGHNEHIVVPDDTYPVNKLANFNITNFHKGNAGLHTSSSESDRSFSALGLPEAVMTADVGARIMLREGLYKWQLVIEMMMLREMEMMTEMMMKGMKEMEMKILLMEEMNAEDYLKGCWGCVQPSQAAQEFEGVRYVDKELEGDPILVRLIGEPQPVMNSWCRFRTPSHSWANTRKRQIRAVSLTTALLRLAALFGQWLLTGLGKNGIGGICDPVMEEVRDLALTSRASTCSWRLAPRGCGIT
eukprot:758323-Hanusia_phi.AAC.5